MQSKGQRLGNFASTTRRAVPQTGNVPEFGKLIAHRCFFSISAKKALESETKFDTVSWISSPI